MDCRQLRYFVAVAEELNFSRAAERLHVSQPPVSIQIKAMEEELGTALLVRNKRSVTLTKAGAVLLKQARETLSSLDQAAELTRLAGRGEAGRLLIAFTNSVPMHDVFGRLLRAFRCRYPNVVVEARQMSTAHQFAALADGTLDLGILRPAYWFETPPEFALRRLWLDELDVFLPPDHPLLERPGPILMEALRDEAFISFASDLGCGLYEHTMMLASNAGFQPKVIQHVSVAGSILGLVAAGAGVAILPRCQSRSGIAGVVNRALEAEGAVSELKLGWRKADESPLLTRFLDVAAEFSDEVALVA